MVCGLWFVVCDLWFVVCGLWFVVVGCRMWFMVCGVCCKLKFVVYVTSSIVWSHVTLGGRDAGVPS